MGLLCAKLRDYCCCSCLLRISWESPPDTEEFQVLILGPAGSGKTELGHRLAGLQRPEDDQQATNGVRCYSASITSEDLPRPAVQLQLTEVGGNPQMQRLWRHYYASSHALIYCFDLATDPEHLQATFNLLALSLKATELAGKPVLLAASRYRDGVQLYDVEYAFGMEQLASSCNCPLLICHMDDAADLHRGVQWLCRQLLARKTQLERRIRYDVNMQHLASSCQKICQMIDLADLQRCIQCVCHQLLARKTQFERRIRYDAWQRRKRSLLSSGKLAQVHRQRFRRQHRKLWPAVEGFGEVTVRPNTAPPTIFFVQAPQVENPQENSGKK